MRVGPDIEKIRRGLPPVRYLAVYRVNLPPPERDVYSENDPDFQVLLSCGPVEFSHSVPVIEYEPPGVGMTMAERHVELPRDSYLLIRTNVQTADPASARMTAALRIAEATCLFDLTYPGLIAERLFHGAVNEPGQYLFLPEGPLRLSAQPKRDVTIVAEEIAERLASLDKLAAGERERFRLASRWFRRGQETLNQVDKLLFLWTVLEIYPAQGFMEVSDRTCELLSDRVYDDLTAQDIKSKTDIGRIEGMHGRIVHQGKAFVAPNEMNEFSSHLDRLEAVCATCLRILAGIPAGEDLDKYVRDKGEG